MSWPAGPDNPVLQDEAVHVWRIALSLDDDRLTALAGTLSAEELNRANRFRFPLLRSRFIAAHGALRDVLARYTGIAAGNLAFTLSSYGKPSLAGSAVRFNLSHSADLALLAVTRAREIGVDIEFMRAEIAGERIAERFFSAREVAALRALPAARQTAAFFSCWTRKEAFIKAVGEGLSYPLDAFDVTLAPDEPAVLLAVRGDAGEASRWTLAALAPGDGYVGAFSVEGKVSKVSYWEWLASTRRKDQHGRERRQDHLQSGCEPRRAVFDMAG